MERFDMPLIHTSDDDAFIEGFEPFVENAEIQFEMASQMSGFNMALAPKFLANVQGKSHDILGSNTEPQIPSAAQLKVSDHPGGNTLNQCSEMAPYNFSSGRLSHISSVIPAETCGTVTAGSFSEFQHPTQTPYSEAVEYIWHSQPPSILGLANRPGIVLDPESQVADFQHKTPTQEDWERLQPLIKRLYCDEHKTLREIMKTMAVEHDHHGTVKMYKSRIKKWNLDKNNKESDMRFILQKTCGPNAIDKETLFLVRGQRVNLERALKYFKRKGGLPDLPRMGARTPSHISYQRLLPVPITVTPPPQFRDLESLLFNINAYFEGSLSNGTWVRKNGSGHCVSIRATSQDQDQFDQFFDYCTAATGFISVDSIVLARLALSKACSLVRNILISEIPSVFEKFLEILSWLINENRDFGQAVLKYISQIVIVIFGPESSRHPLSLIWGLINATDLDDFHTVVTKCLQCTVALFEKTLGRFSFHTMNSKIWSLEFMSQKDLSTAERLLQDLLGEARQILGETDLSILNVKRKLIVIQIRCGQYLKAESVLKEFLDIAKKRRMTSEDIHSLEVLAYLQYKLGDPDMAVNLLKEAVGRTRLLEASNLWTTRLLQRLQGWYREWDMVEERDELQIEIDHLAGNDEIDQDLESWEMAQ